MPRSDPTPDAPTAARLLPAFEEVQEVVFLYDPDWRIRYMNGPARRVIGALGIDPDAAIGRVLWELVPSAVGTRFETESRAAAKSGVAVEYEEYQPRLNRWFFNRVIPLADGFVAGISRDITVERSEPDVVDDHEAQFRMMVDAIPNLAWIANADGWIFWYNRRWYEYTGTTPAQMEGWGWKSVHDPRVLPDVLERWTTSIRTGEPFSMEFPLLGADGVFRPFLTRVNPVRDAEGVVLRWVGTNTDVSEQRAAVADRERLLDAERELRAAAEEANRAKSQFLATMSHELRTPLNAIGGYTDLLDAGVAGHVNEGQRQYLRRIARNQQMLLGLINDILNYAKLEAGRVHYELQPVPAARITEDMAAILEVQLVGTGIEWHSSVEPSLVVYADPEKVLQIMINLCSNAIKAMPDGGRLQLDCRSEDDFAVFEVCDTGVGIPSNRIDFIFEPFVQLDRDLTKTKDGTGLGLAISRDLAHAMNGTLTARSEVGRGSCFTVKLPRSASP